MESLKHQYAKETLAQWLRGKYAGEMMQAILEHFRQTVEIVVEYPVCAYKADILGHETAFNPAPTYDECIADNLLPIAIFDVAILINGTLRCAYEVVHKHDISPLKEEYLKRIGAARSAPLPVYTLDAEWILSHAGRQDAMQFLTERKYA